MSFFAEENTDKRKDNSLWVERYRPTKLSEYVGNEHLKETIGEFIKNGDVPHLLFYGKPGTGKTTLGKLIANAIDCDLLMINASDENGIDIIRNKIKNFASTVGFRNSKVIMLDEADFLTIQAQSTLRNLMETFSRHCRFILTCNYVERINPAIRSRCQEFQIIPPSKKEVAVQVVEILKSEKIEFDIHDIVPIVDAAYPDIRKIINTVQLNSSKGILKLNKSAVADSDAKSHIVKILASKDTTSGKYNAIRQIVANARVQDFSDFYGYLYEKVDEYAPGKTSSVIILLAEAQYKDAMIVDKEINFMSAIIQIIAELSN